MTFSFHYPAYSLYPILLELHIRLYKISHYQVFHLSSIYRLYMFGGVLAIILLSCWLFALSPFLWGAVVGSFFTYCILRLFNFVMTYLFFPSGSTVNGACCCFTTSVSPDATCCSLHNSFLTAWRPPYAGPLVLPQLRDLQAPPVPQLVDEDLRSGPSSGPLGESLGYKLDKHHHPVYKAWMNEVCSFLLFWR